MKKIILLLLITLALISCERKSGRRPVQDKLYIIEYVEDSSDTTIEVRFADRYSASKYRNGLDSLNIWSRLYSSPINSIK